MYTRVSTRTPVKGKQETLRIEIAERIHRRFEDRGETWYRNNSRKASKGTLESHGRAPYLIVQRRALIAAPSGRNYHNSSR